MKIISVYNNKGGVGKSTTVQFLADFFASIKINSGKARVLVVDIDGQSSSFTSLLGIHVTSSAINTQKTLPHYLLKSATGKKPDLIDYCFERKEGETASKTMTLGRLHVMMSDEEGMDIFDNKHEIDSATLIKDFRKKAAKEFDLVIIDLPANIREGNLLCMMGLEMSDFLLIPVEPNRIVINALPKTFNKIRFVQSKSKSKKPKIIGMLLNKTDKRLEQYQKHHKELEVLAAQNETIIFKNTLPNASALASATDDSHDFATLKERYQNYYDHVRKAALEIAVACGYTINRGSSSKETKKR